MTPQPVMAGLRAGHPSNDRAGGDMDGLGSASDSVPTPGHDKRGGGK